LRLEVPHFEARGMLSSWMITGQNSLTNLYAIQLNIFPHVMFATRTAIAGLLNRFCSEAEIESPVGCGEI
jgi:hypothetical protein